MSDVDELMLTSDRLLREVVPGTRGLWPRVVAFSLRAALELEVDAFWAREQADVVGSPMRTKLLLLWAYADREVCRQTTELWHELSRATHQHAYELAPTAQELRGWYLQVNNLSQQLR